MNEDPWWDGYNQNYTVVIDEYAPGALPEYTMKRMLSITPYHVQVKFGMLPFDSPQVVFISNSSFDDCFPPGLERYDAIRRRFNRILRFVPGLGGDTEILQLPLPKIGRDAPSNLATLGARLAAIMASPLYFDRGSEIPVEVSDTDDTEPVTPTPPKRRRVPA